MQRLNCAMSLERHTMQPSQNTVQGCDGVEQMRVWLEIYYMSMKWQCRSPMLSVVAVGGEGGGVVFYYNSLMYFTGWKTERLA